MRERHKLFLRRLLLYQTVTLRGTEPKQKKRLPICRALFQSLTHFQIFHFVIAVYLCSSLYSFLTFTYFTTKEIEDKRETFTKNSTDIFPAYEFLVLTPSRSQACFYQKSHVRDPCFFTCPIYNGQHAKK